MRERLEQSEARLLKSEKLLQQSDARLAELEASNSEKWLNEHRAEEIKSLVSEVLADADTRASLLQDGAVAGHNGKNFFLSTADNTFLMKIAGHLQFRYLLNTENTGPDSTDEGFQVRRAKVKFSGHVTAGRKWDYTLVLASSRKSGTNTSAEDIIIGTKLKEDLRVDVGKTKLPFLRQELTSSSRQLAADRSSFTEFFTLNRGEQIRFTYTPSDVVKMALSISDGSNSGTSDIGADGVRFAVTSRVDWKIAGEWSQMKDYTAWSGEPKGIFVGGAVHYQAGDDNNTAIDGNYLAWTFDASIEVNNFGLSAAVAGGSTDFDTATDVDPIGFEIQASYLIKDDLEPFVRFEWIDDDVTSDETVILTLGANHYIKKHNAKLTIDTLWLLSDDDGLDGTLGSAGFGSSPFGSGLGFSGDGAGENTALLRAQLQLLF